MGLSYWDGAYRTDRKVWGESPSELAQSAKKFIEEVKLPMEGKRLLDIGCGYGRDASFLSQEWKCRALGVDSSETAVAMAMEGLAKIGRRDVEFRRAVFQDLREETFQLVFASNFYQILSPEERKQFCDAVPTLLEPGGLFFLSTHSVRDPEHLGKGNTIPGDPDSYLDSTYVHLSTQRELEKNFKFLVLHRLYEHEFLEPRSDGETHHHISWILIGSLPMKGK